MDKTQLAIGRWLLILLLSFLAVFASFASANKFRFEGEVFNLALDQRGELPPLPFGNPIGKVPAPRGGVLANQTVNIPFVAKVGEQIFRCGQTYPLGKDQTAVRVTDFRLYIHDMALINREGERVPVQLEQDGIWQYQNLALLDFENKAKGCNNGTRDMRKKVTGNVPKADYKGLEFTLGVPFELNHGDATIAASPLNLTALFWSWQGGYKFARIDLKNAPTAAAKSFNVHLGSTGCASSTMLRPPTTSCANPNTVRIHLANFDPKQDQVIVDLAALLADSDLTTNAPNTHSANTHSGCMSFPEDSDCSSIMRRLGLPYDGQAGGEQVFFRHAKKP